MPHDDFSKIDEEFYSTILDEDFHFEGTIKFEDSLIIKGYVKGRIESQGDLIVGPRAIIDADIKAKSLECFGNINGNISIQNETFLHSPSRLNGNVETPVLTFERGCLLNGNVAMKPVQVDA
jgi:cytoskeletal protein CcmA (bactofilin family)